MTTQERIHELELECIRQRTEADLVQSKQEIAQSILNAKISVLVAQNNLAIMSMFYAAMRDK